MCVILQQKRRKKTSLVEHEVNLRRNLIGRSLYLTKPKPETSLSPSQQLSEVLESFKELSVNCERTHTFRFLNVS